jgi:hypothetical protein
MFQCGHTFHISCCNASSVRKERCPECRSNVIEQLEQLGWKNMSREERLLAFIHEVSTEVMEIDSNSSEVIPQDQPSVEMLNGPTRSYTVLRDRSSGPDRTDRGPRSREAQQDRVKTDIGPMFRSFFFL